MEVDLSSSSLIRMGVSAAFGVPEVWRWIGDELHVLRLTPDGEYAEAETSAALPMLPIGGLGRFLDQRGEVDENSIVRSFRAWVRAGFRP